MRLWKREIVGLIIIVAVILCLVFSCSNRGYDDAFDPDCHYKAETGTYFCPDEDEEEEE